MPRDTPQGHIQLTNTFDSYSAAINASGAGDNTIVTGVAGKHICVCAFVLQGYGTVAAKFTDGTGGDAITGPFTFQTREGISSPCAAPPNYLFECTAGNALVLNLSAAIQVVGFVSYLLENTG